MIELIAVKVGAKLSLIGGITAEVVDKIDDEWVKVKLLTVPEGKGSVGDEELCHATDVTAVL
jgi:predicted aconitase with swiveling domain